MGHDSRSPVCTSRAPCMDGEAAELVMRRLSSRRSYSEVCRADRSRGKEAPFDHVLASPSSVMERSIQAHSGGAADEAGFEVVGDVTALAPTPLHHPSSLSLLALPAELLTLVAEQLDAHCIPGRARTPDEQSRPQAGVLLTRSSLTLDRQRKRGEEPRCALPRELRSSFLGMPGGGAGRAARGAACSCDPLPGARQWSGDNGPQCSCVVPVLQFTGGPARCPGKVTLTLILP